MRVKIERRWDDGEWETYRESVDLDDVRIGESGHLVKSIFEGEPTGASLTVTGFVLNGLSDYRYTLLPDPVKRKVIRCIAGKRKGEEWDVLQYGSIDRWGLDILPFFTDGRRQLGDALSFAVGDDVHVFQLAETEIDE